MYGLIFAVFEEFILQTFDLQTWHSIKAKAGCKIPDDGFVSKMYYEDKDLINLVLAASNVLSLSMETVLESYGVYFTTYIYNNGYENLLLSSGRTLRQWLSNVNGTHEYLGRQFPKAEYRPPVFWCEDDDNNNGSLLLHYYSYHDPLFANLAEGIVKEVARRQFDASNLRMDKIEVQGQDGSELTTWRISVTDPEKQWILLDKKFEKPPLTSRTRSADNLHCPFSGHTLSVSEFESLQKDNHRSRELEFIGEYYPESRKDKEIFDSKNGQIDEFTSRLMSLFPYHVLVDKNFVIEHVGDGISHATNLNHQELVGIHIGQVLEINRYVVGCQWSLSSLKKLLNQKFYIGLKVRSSPQKYQALRHEDEIKFSSSLLEMNDSRLMFLLSPDARNVDELKAAGLSLADLPLHGAQRDVVLLGEHINQEAIKSEKLERLSKALEKERNLSDKLLYNMLPREIANDLRQGRVVQAKHYKNVTLFFSDIEGFTSMCDRLHPNEVIILLNKLYSVMDYLASQFGLYKVETVGDAYMCCSGLPSPDELHAENIANFALAVRECVKYILSPVDGKSIKLRIGIHTGDCTAGIVGTLTPHFCLFGDMVNLTSRLENTSLSNRIQCSAALYELLRSRSTSGRNQYVFVSRGGVEIKGKGVCQTYWLEAASAENEFVNRSGLDVLLKHVQLLLQNNEWKVNLLLNTFEDKGRSAPSNVIQVGTCPFGSSGKVQNNPSSIDEIGAIDLKSNTCSFATKPKQHNNPSPYDEEEAKGFKFMQQNNPSQIDQGAATAMSATSLYEIHPIRNQSKCRNVFDVESISMKFRQTSFRTGIVMLVVLQLLFDMFICIYYGLFLALLFTFILFVTLFAFWAI